MVYTVCETCKYENDDKYVGRCLYCRSVYDDTGDFCEYEYSNDEL